MVGRKFFVICALAVSLLAGSANLSAQANEEDEVIKVDVALVNIPFSVSDREGRSILGLKAADFSFFEDGKPQKIEYLSTQDNPLNVVLMLDTSQSTQENFTKVINAASQFVTHLKPNDRCMIVSFDQAARVKSEFTSDQKTLNKAINRSVLSRNPGTLMRDAISVIVNQELAKVKGRKAIILITDGKDAGSKTDKDALLHRLAESDAPIYSVIYEIDHLVTQPVSPKTQKPAAKNLPLTAKQIEQLQSARLKRNDEAAEYVEKMSDVTAGRSYRKEINNLGEAFDNITEELRKQYLLGFYPDGANYDVSKHQIKIKVDQKNAVVRMKNYTLLKR